MNLNTQDQDTRGWLGSLALSLSLTSEKAAEEEPDRRKEKEGRV